MAMMREGESGEDDEWITRVTMEGTIGERKAVL